MENNNNRERFFESEEGIGAAVELMDLTLTAWSTLPEGCIEPEVTVSLRDLLTLVTLSATVLHYLDNDAYKSLMAKHPLLRDAERVEDTLEA